MASRGFSRRPSKVRWLSGGNATTEGIIRFARSKGTEHQPGAAAAEGPLLLLTLTASPA